MEINAKDNYIIFKEFYVLYKSIIDCEIFVPSKCDVESCKTEKMLQKTYQKYDMMNDFERDLPCYNNLVKENKIIWYSDDGPIDNVNYLEIILKNNNTIVLKIFKNKKNCSSSTIRFCNSGSRYSPFNIVFMRMFNNLQEYNPNEHQLHLLEL